jgi:RDD family protein
MMQIRVARLDGAPLAFGNLVLRWLLRIVDFFLGTTPGIGIFTIIVTEKHQRLGDMAASTIVVSTKERTSMANTFYRETPADYVPVFHGADRLSAREAEIIQEVFYQYRQNDKCSLITLAAAKVKELLQVNTDLDDLTFLKTVMKDYNFIASSEGKSFESREGFSFSL